MSPLTLLGRVACTLGIVLAVATSASWFGYLACAKAAVRDLRRLQARHKIPDRDPFGLEWAECHPGTALALNLWMTAALAGIPLAAVLATMLVRR